MKTSPFYYPFFNNRGRKGQGGAPTDRSPRGRRGVRTSSGVLMALAVTAVALVPGGNELAQGQTPTPPPVVTPAAVPGGVTIVAPAGSTVVPGPSGTPAAVMAPGARPAPSGVPAATLAPGAVPAPTPIPPGSTRTTTKRTVTTIPGATVSGGTIIPSGPMTTTTTTSASGGNAVITPQGVVMSQGVMDAWEPGTRFVVREQAGPVAYTYGPQTVYSTPSGQVLTAEQVTVRMRAGLPVRVEYVPQGNTRVIQRVIIDER